MLWLSLLLLAIAAQQYYDLFGLNALYVEQIEPWHSRTLLRGYGPRAIGMIGNPNELGFLFTVTTLVAVHFLTERFRPRYVLLLLANVGGILLTGSRTSLAACAVGVLVLVAARLLRGRSVRVMTIIQGSLVALGIVLAGAASLPGAQWDDRMVRRFEELASPTEAPSFQARLVRWETNLEMFKDSPLLGVGPLRRVQMLAGDNEWLLLLRSYGVLGTLALVLAFLLPQWLGPSTAVRALGSVLLFTSALYMVTLAVFYSLALMPVVLIVLALGDATVRIKVLSGTGDRTWPHRYQTSMRNAGRLPTTTASPPELQPWRRPPDAGARSST